MFYVRIVYGLLFGLTLVIPSILITELVTKMWRGRFIIITFATYEIGKIYLICLCFIYLEDYETGNWRGMILVNVWPALIVFFGSLFFLYESPRLHLIKEKFSKAFSTINKIGILNQGDNYEKLIFKEVKTYINKYIERLISIIYISLKED